MTRDLPDRITTGNIIRVALMLTNLNEREGDDFRITLANKQVLKSNDQEAESVLKVNLEPEDEEEVPHLVDESE